MNLLFLKIAESAHILTVQLSTEKEDKSVSLLWGKIIVKLDFIKDYFSFHGSVQTLIPVMPLWSFEKIDEVACSCCRYVTGQQETLFRSHLFGRDNGSGIISFHSELIWAASVLLLRNMTCRGDEIQVPGCLSTSLWETIKFTYKSAHTRGQVYTIYIHLLYIQ